MLSELVARPIVASQQIRPGSETLAAEGLGGGMTLVGADGLSALMKARFLSDVSFTYSLCITISIHNHKYIYCANV